MTHTPGPWINDPHPTDECSRIITAPRPNKIGLRYTMATVEGFSRQEADTNARLIAAAPELLEGCEAALAYLVEPVSIYPENRRGAAEIIRAAIAKATQP